MGEGGGHAAETVFRASPFAEVSCCRAKWKTHKNSACVKLKLQAATFMNKEVQSSAKRWALGLVNLVDSLAYHYCLTLPEAFT